MGEHERRAAFDAIWRLREHTDDDSNRALVDFMESDDLSVALEAARVLARRDVAADLRELVGAPLLRGDATRTFAFEACARALVAHPRAVELLAPLLRAGPGAAEVDRVRTRMIFHCVEERLAHGSLLDAPARALPDPRFRELAAEIAGLDAELAWYATAIAAGFDFFSGIRIEPPYRWAEFVPDDVLPLVVAGFRFGYDTVPEAMAVGPGAPRGLTAIRHQHGCLSCAQERVFGYVLALPDHAAILAALEEINFEQCNFRDGYMSDAGLARANYRLSPLLEHRITSGREGLLVADGPRPAALRGLPVVHFGTTFAPWRNGIDVEMHRDIVHRGVFGAEHELALRDIGDCLGLEPSTVVIMENCD